MTRIDRVHTYCHSLGKLMIQSQRTTVSIKQAHIVVTYNSIYKTKMLTHGFKKSHSGLDSGPMTLLGRRATSTHNKSTLVSWRKAQMVI